MNFEKPNLEYKSEKIKIRAKPKGFKEKFKHNIRKTALVGGLGAGAIAGGYVVNDKYPRDYTEQGSFNAAFKKAKEDKRKVFKWNHEYYEVKLVDKEFSDNYWESKKFLEEYYASNYFKSKHLENKKEGEERLANLKEPTQFTITETKNRDTNGFYDRKSGEVFLSKKTDDTYETLPVHELTHKATRGLGNEQSLKNATYEEKYNFINSKLKEIEKRNPEFIEKYGEKTASYLIEPTEIDARQNSVRFWLFKHFTGYTANTVFTPEHYDFLNKNYKKLPKDIQELVDLYSKKEVFVFNMNKY